MAGINRLVFSLFLFVVFVATSSNNIDSEEKPNKNNILKRVFYSTGYGPGGIKLVKPSITPPSKEKNVREVLLVEKKLPYKFLVYQAKKLQEEIKNLKFQLKNANTSRYSYSYIKNRLNKKTLELTTFLGILKDQEGK